MAPVSAIGARRLAARRPVELISVRPHDRGRPLQTDADATRQVLMARRPVSDPFRGAGMLHSVMAKRRPRTTVAVILFATLGTCAAQANDAVRPGKWAFSAVVSEPRAPLGAELGSNGLALRETQCITSDDPLPPMARGPSTPRYGHQTCKIDQTNVSGGTVSWSMTCAMPQIMINVDGVVHYHGVTVEGEYTVHGVIPGQPPINKTMPVTGLYLGPCDSN